MKQIKRILSLVLVFALFSSSIMTIDVSADYEVVLDCPVLYQFNYTNYYWVPSAGVYQNVSGVGCGHTSSSMVVNYYYPGQANPEEMFQWTINAGLYYGMGSDHGHITQMVGRWGLSATWTADANAAADAILQGKPIVYNVGVSEFTDGGHYMVLDGCKLVGGVRYFRVLDPWSSTKTYNWYSVSYLDSIKQFHGASFCIVGPGKPMLTDKLTGHSPDKSIPGGCFVKLKSQQTNKYLTRQSDNTVYVKPENDSLDQLWKMVKNSDGTYTLINARNGYALDIYGAATATGSRINVHASNGSNAQKFYVYNYGGGYHFRACYLQDMVLDISLSNEWSHLWTVNDSAPQQRFTIEKVDVAGNLPLFDLGDFTTKIKLDSGKYFSKSGNNACVDNTGIEWTFTRNTNGTYTIADPDGNVLDCADAKFDAGINVMTHTPNGGKNQQFYLYKIDGKYLLKPNGGTIYGEAVVVDVDAASSNVHLYTHGTADGNKAAQRYELVNSPDDVEYIPLEKINQNANTSASQIWTSGTFTAVYWGVLVLAPSAEGYTVTAKYLSGATKSVAASTNNPLIVVHSGHSAYAAFLTVEVGQTVTLSGVNPSTSWVLNGARVKLPYGFVLNNDSKYTLYGDEEKFIKPNGKNKTASDITAQFKCKVKVFKMDNTEFGSAEICGTGSVVKYYGSDGSLKESATVIVNGDINGDGTATSADCLMQQSHLQSSAPLNNVFLIAADYDGNGSVTAADYLSLATDIINGK